MTGTIDQRLADLGITLPVPPQPIASYVPYVVEDGFIYVSGQVSLGQDGDAVRGKLGADLSLEQGQHAAWLCGLNILAQLRAALDGDLDRITRIVKLGGFVNATDDFTDQPKVINGASDLMAEVFGDTGRHARSAVGVNTLPLGFAVEIDAVAAFE